MQRGYYATEMKIITLGKIKDLKLSSTAPNGEDQSFNPLLRKQARHQFKTYSSIHSLTGAKYKKLNIINKLIFLIFPDYPLC